MNNTKVFLIFLVLLAFLSLKAQSGQLEHRYLENFAKIFVESQLDVPENAKTTIKVTKIDPRIKIKSCVSDIIANIPEKTIGRNVNVKISCVDSMPWSIYLPVKVSFSIPILVAKQAIDKGTLFTKENIGLVYRENHKIRGTYLKDINSALGSKAKRKISKNRTITHKNICMVCKGANVSIIAKSKHFIIKTMGIALRDGTLGDQVLVRNTKSGKTIIAEVNAINKVVINL